MERRQRPGLRSRAPMSELPWPRPLHTHIPPLATRGAASRETSRGRGSGLRSAAPHTRGGGGAGGGGCGGGRGPGRARGREEAPGRGGRGSGRRRGEGRARRAAAPSGGRAGGAGGQAGQRGSREPHEVPPGPRTGRCPGEAVGGSPTSMAKRGPRRRARSKSGSGGRRPGEGWRRRWVGVTPGLAGAGGLVRLGVSRRRLLGARWSRQPRAARLRGFFGNLQMFS